MWVRTVFSLMSNVSAIKVLLLPFASRHSTSSSRSVSPSCVASSSQRRSVFYRFYAGGGNLCECFTSGMVSGQNVAALEAWE